MKVACLSGSTICYSLSILQGGEGMVTMDEYKRSLEATLVGDHRVDFENCGVFSLPLPPKAKRSKGASRRGKGHCSNLFLSQAVQDDSSIHLRI